LNTPQHTQPRIIKTAGDAAKQQPAPPPAPSPQQPPALAPRAPSAVAASPQQPPSKVTVRFWMKFRVEYGQSVRVTGGAAALGAWDVAKAPAMQWSSGDLWSVSLELDAGAFYVRRASALLYVLLSF
jgi:hypothetical protein